MDSEVQGENMKAFYKDSFKFVESRILFGDNKTGVGVICGFG